MELLVLVNHKNIGTVVVNNSINTLYQQNKQLHIYLFH